MKRAIYLFGAWFLLAGCEQVDGLKDQMFGEKVPDEAAETAPPETESPETSVPVEIDPLPERPPPEPEQPTPPPPEPEPTGPVQPKPSRELLRIVSNWRAIPHSAFPRKVTINTPLAFNLRDSSGNRVGGVNAHVGSQVVAFEQVGNMLSVGPSLASPMRSMIGMDQTDLKLVLTYAYELNKLRQAELSMSNVPRSTVRVVSRPRVSRPASKPNTTTRPTTRPAPIRKPTPQANPTPRSSTKPTPGSNKKDKDPGPLFEDVPEAKAVNPDHGKWCVCRDCRTRRGAGRGGVLYPNQ